MLCGVCVSFSSGDLGWKFDRGGEREGGGCGGRLVGDWRGGIKMYESERGQDACFILINRQYVCMRTPA
jgi:hypothetical protein